MRILFCRWNSICEIDMKAALVTLGYEVEELFYQFDSVDYDTKYVEILSERMMGRHYDLVFSVNYIPIISRVCNIFKTIYASWTVDSPLFQFYSETIYNQCNRIFIFDYMLYQEFCQENPGRIFYLPLAANTDHLDGMIPGEKEIECFSTDISFVGSLYTEKCKYNGIKENLPDYLRGYVEGIMEAQFKVYGYNFIQDALPEDIVKALRHHIGWFPLGSDYRENDRAIVAQEYLGVKCSELERRRLLAALAERYSLHLYTLSDTSDLKGVINRGPARSRLDMPMIFKCSKINLNITAKTIRSGLSQRVFDVLGAGGFLITNYQFEIPEYFEAGKDLVVYESEEDLLQKCEYYLSHESERLEIARSGYEKVKQKHTFTIRMEEMLQNI